LTSQALYANVKEWARLPCGGWYTHKVTSLYTLMYAETLQELGLSPNEARIYESLLEFGEASVSDVATHTSIHRRDVYDVMNRLVDKSFVSPVLGKKDAHYVPVEPVKFREIIEEKREKLEKILPDMLNLFKSKKVEEGIYTYKGIEGYKNLLRDELSAKSTIYTIGGKGLWRTPHPNPITKNFLAESKKRGLTFQVLFDATIKEENEEISGQSNLTHRFLPKNYTGPTAVDIYDDRVVTVTGRNLDEPQEDITIFMMVSQEVADTYRKWFQYMWDNAEKTEKSAKPKNRK
jgi:sugar-specific transcriptional regulator TrmB